VYFETAFFFGVFFVALPTAAPASAAIEGIGTIPKIDGTSRNLYELSKGAPGVLPITSVLWTTVEVLG
jgi:hypothetical protein